MGAKEPPKFYFRRMNVAGCTTCEQQAELFSSKGFVQSKHDPSIHCKMQEIEHCKCDECSK